MQPCNITVWGLVIEKFFFTVLVSLFNAIMKHFCYTWIEDWCQENGWTDPFIRERNEYWAFPPNAVMPLPIPSNVLRLIKQQRGLSLDEKRWCFAAVASALLGSVFSSLLQCPMPIVIAFAFCAITVAQLEVED